MNAEIAAGCEQLGRLKERRDIMAMVHRMAQGRGDAYWAVAKEIFEAIDSRDDADLPDTVIVPASAAVREVECELYCEARR